MMMLRIGANVTILDGVSVGRGFGDSRFSRTKSVNPYSIVGGVPAIPIGKRGN